MATKSDGFLESELGFLEGEGELGFLEGEGELGFLEGEGALGFLEGEGEGELGFLEGEGELGFLEGEGELGFLEGEGELGFLEGEGEGELGNILGGLLGNILGEGEGELSFLEGEQEQEQFFKRAFRSIGRFVKRNVPMLKNIAKIAAPLVATAVGGPAAGALARKAAGLLGEGELEGEMGFLEGEGEAMPEGEQEASHFTQHEALAEQMAHYAAQASTEMEAEAMTGAASATVISPQDRAELRRILPHIVRGAAVLTRILRRRPRTRPLVRTVPTVVRRTTRTLARRAAAGQPITRPVAGRVMAAQTRRVLSNPRTCAVALARNVRATRAVANANRRQATRESQFAP